MGGDDRDGTAPLGDGFGDAEEEALIFVEGEFVELDVTAFASEGIGAGGDAVDAAAVGEVEHLGGDVVFCVEDDCTEIDGVQVEEGSPVFAIFEVEPGCDFVA